jgi:hypothetical protein
MGLKGFNGLTSLELYQFYGLESQLVKDIANVLSDCPGLRKLGLGMACDFNCDQFPELLEVDGNYGFLENLCLEYGTRSSPLALETLRLGHGLFLYESTSPDTGNYLAKLVKIKDIKTLHIFNGPIFEGDGWEEGTPMEVDWDLFAECTSLHQLSVSRMDGNVRQWLNTIGKSVQELFVMDHYSMYDGGLYNFDLLELPQLSMIFTREMTVRKRDRDDAWPEIVYLGSRSDSLDADVQPSDSLRPQKHDRSLITVLDRLRDNGANLTQLGICVDLETQWVSC